MYILCVFRYCNTYYTKNSVVINTLLQIKHFHQHTRFICNWLIFTRRCGIIYIRSPCFFHSPMTTFLILILQLHEHSNSSLIQRNRTPQRPFIYIINIRVLKQHEHLFITTIITAILITLNHIRSVLSWPCNVLLHFQLFPEDKQMLI